MNNYMHVIEFCGFSKSYKDFNLNDLNFKINSGFITGLIGPNGAGKTTLINAIMNLIPPDKGEVIVFNKSMGAWEREIKQRIGFVYDEDFYYNHLSIKEMGKIIASFYSNWNHAVFKQYLTDFKLPERKKIGNLSKGMKIKFSLAAALAHEPDLLIMDEPTSGLDPVFRRRVLSILSDYIQDGNRSVLFSTHISTDLERIADYIVYISNGQLIFSGSKEELLDEYFILKGPVASQPMKKHLIGLQQSPLGFEGLISKNIYSENSFDSQVVVEKPTLDDILVYTQGDC
ncbi:ABC transporter ATP-binding protein [Cytobacillus sp. IB215316]|uniref:ABC transporter ATP-binding protein n=1 Tax=Cytobacillus sp. IB215316 TaxID=3097354 RepID=UPI002A15E112|nr:ABC transporter ATP-binding protein [Cytobacillus sp. IB215316]MDX8360486.1 ABC transporter ATP-binding protein [Cytobacillus sp. IB215316]